MSIGIDVGDEHFPIGAASFFKCFFSTIHVRLEPGAWGSKFPLLLKHLYWGRIDADDAGGAVKELDDIRAGLSLRPPSDVVWDFEDRAAQPPWGDRIAQHITSLGNYYVTSDGEDLIDVLRCALAKAALQGQAAFIR